MIPIRRPFLGLCLLLLLWSAGYTIAQPADAPTPITVATRVLPPFVIAADDQTRTLSGFSVDLWHALADRLNLDTTWATFDSVGAVLNAVETGEAAAAIAGITITAERETRVDFSVPMFNAGLDILAREDAGLTLTDFLHILLSSQVTQIVLVMVIVIFIAGNIVWLIERRGNGDFNRSYRQGLFEGIWWAAVTVATVGYGDKTPRSIIGRLIAILWMFMGIALVAQFTAVITSGVTLANLRGAITAVDDLYGRPIGTVAGTTAEAYLRGLAIAPQTYPNFDAAAAALLDNRIDAIVYDAPVLEYYVNRAGRGRAQTTGQIFDQEYYGIAVPTGSPLRERLNAALLALYEDGTYQALYDRWFGP